MNCELKKQKGDRLGFEPRTFLLTLGKGKMRYDYAIDPRQILTWFKFYFGVETLSSPNDHTTQFLNMGLIPLL